MAELILVKFPHADEIAAVDRDYFNGEEGIIVDEPLWKHPEAIAEYLDGDLENANFHYAVGMYATLVSKLYRHMSPEKVGEFMVDLAKEDGLIQI